MKRPTLESVLPGKTEPMRWALDDPKFKACPYPYYSDMLATNRRVIRALLPSGTSVCLTFGYVESLNVLRDHRFVKSVPMTSGAVKPHPLFINLVALDPPNHTRLRTIMMEALSRRDAPELQTLIANLAREAVAALEEREMPRSVDLVAQFAVPFVTRVMCRLIGLPEDDAGRIASWSWALNAAESDPAILTQTVASEIDGYLRKRIKTAERDDNCALASLLDALDAGRLSSEEVRSSVLLLMMAGFETSANLIASSVLRMLKQKELWLRLASDAVEPQRAVDELLRVEAPLDFATPRYAAAEVQLGGLQIQRGEMVFAGLGSANRDPAIFDRPNDVDFCRMKGQSHLTFGFGRHACPGGTIGRMLTEAALVSLARSFPNLSLACPANELTWWPSLVMRGMHRLPVDLRGSSPTG